MVFPDLASFGRKFFLSGRGLSLRTGKYFIQAIFVGFFAGWVVVAFRHLINLGTDLIFSRVCCCSYTRPVFLVLPALGALLGYLLIRRFDSLEHARGTDSAVLAFHRRHGYVPPAVLPVKSVASVLTVASGGSAGYEGPVTLLGAACGSLVASWFGLSRRARRILMTAGISAGIAALFQAPLAGAIFGFEVLYSSSDIEYDCILPCFVASTVAYTIYAYFFGWGALFPMPGNVVYSNGLRLLPYFVLALIVTFGVRFYISCFTSVERSFGAMRCPGWLKVLLGGLVTGLIGFFVPQVLGTSYPVIQRTLSYDSASSAACALLLAIFFAKTVATSFTVGSGGSGGVFAPAIVMVAEISGNHQLIVPAMWVCGIAFWLNNGWTLYRSQPHNREASPVHD